jgi:hypothetical protein
MCFGFLALLGEHVLHSPGGNDITPATKRLSYALSASADDTNAANKLRPAGVEPTLAEPQPAAAAAAAAAAAGGAPVAYVMNAPVNLTTLRKVYQIGNPRSASTYQWYLLCAILRVVGGCTAVECM